MIRRLLRDCLVLLAMFLSLAVLPFNLERALEYYFPRVVDCGRALQPGEHRVSYIIADGRVRVKCR